MGGGSPCFVSVCEIIEVFLWTAAVAVDERKSNEQRLLIWINERSRGGGGGDTATANVLCSADDWRLYTIGWKVLTGAAQREIETRRQEIEFFIVEFTVNRFNALWLMDGCFQVELIITYHRVQRSDSRRSTIQTISSCTLEDFKALTVSGFKCHFAEVLLLLRRAVAGNIQFNWLAV